ncbi:MAG: lycopene cyclase family protein, partial [Candidatus Thermoplasmatota archaeon]|nr:lycopene cyclase family protein [Candidatus Thermoplasmatota archaeon]
MMTVETVLLGDGVAAMSLASVADQLPTHSFTVMQPEGAPEPHDHMLGFWNTEGLDFAASGARASWSKWSIVTHEATTVLSSSEHAYHVMHKLAYLDRCKTVAATHNVAFAAEADRTDADLVFDSRPPRSSSNAMLQHFHGLEVEIDRPAFDDSTAILMDFRVDQSHGMHFIYLLPFSKTRALVESTIFST